MPHYIKPIFFAIYTIVIYGLSSFVLSAPINLSVQEESFFQSKKNIKICVATNFMPHEDIVNGKYVGMVSEYVKLISNNLNKPFVLYPTKSWEETMNSLQQGHCDVIPLISKTPERSKLMNFTQPYYIEPLVIATKDDTPFIVDVEDILLEKLAIVRGYAYVELLNNRYPNVKIIEVDSAGDGLKRLHDGEVYAYLGALNVIGYHIQKSDYRDIKINGTLHNKLNLSMGTRIDDPVLNSILNKALNSISKSDRKSIKNSWVKVKYEQRLDYQTIILAFIIGITIFAFFLYHYQILRKHNRLLETLSETDKLTGLNNRLKLDHFLQFHLDIFERHHECFSVVLIDIDHFKKFNDRFGHLIGDKVLAHVAELLRRNCRKLDMVGRWGGEEFLVICPKTNLQEANILAETLRSLIESSHLENIDSVTISVGIAQIKISDNVNIIISRADSALFKAKQGGRNRIELSD